MKTLSMREQLDCLIVSLEANLESMRSYMKTCEGSMERIPEPNIIYTHYHGMKSGAEFCAEMIQHTLDAAKKQRARWNNE